MISPLRIFAILSSVLLLSSCTKLELLDATIPRYGYNVKETVAYGKLPRQTLDIYIPENLEKGEYAPVIVFFYGGSWQRGAKEDYRFVGESLSHKGYVTVIANYRLYPEVSFPAFVEDSALAVAWVHHHIRPYGGDPKNLYVAGHSAGAYNAMMLSLDPHYMKAVGGSPKWIRGAIGLSGPYDFLPVKDPTITAIFASAAASATQPALLKYNHHEVPALFLATGEADTLVVPKNTESLVNHLKKHKTPVETHYYPGINHPGVAQALASPFTRIAPVVPDIVQFIENTRK